MQGSYTFLFLVLSAVLSAVESLLSGDWEHSSPFITSTLLYVSLWVILLHRTAGIIKLIISSHTAFTALASSVKIICRSWAAPLKMEMKLGGFIIKETIWRCFPSAVFITGMCALVILFPLRVWDAPETLALFSSSNTLWELTRRRRYRFLWILCPFLIADTWLVVTQCGSSNC